MRNLTLLEKLFLINTNFSNRDSIQLILEAITDKSFSLQKFKLAINKVGEIRRIHQRKVRGNRWVLDKTAVPYIRVHNIDKPLSPSMSLFNEPMHVRERLIEYHLFVYGNSFYVVIRAQHALMDGSGYLLHLKEIFDSYNGESAEPMPSTLLSEVNSFPDEFKPKPWRLQSLIPNRVSGIRSFRKYDVPEVISFQSPAIMTVAKIAAAVAKVNEKNCRIFIPFDLRKYGKVTSAFTNLTLPVFLTVNPDDHPYELSMMISNGIKNLEPCDNHIDFPLLKWMPISLLAVAMRVIINISRLTGFYYATGYVSNLGFVSLSDFNGKGLRSTDLSPIPNTGTQSPYTAFIIAHENGLRIGLSSTVKSGLDLWKSQIIKSLEEK